MGAGTAGCQTTGRLSTARPAFEALFEIATEGCKFNCGPLVSSQRPARVNEGILSRCNTQIIAAALHRDPAGVVLG